MGMASARISIRHHQICTALLFNYRISLVASQQATKGDINMNKFCSTFRESDFNSRRNFLKSAAIGAAAAGSLVFKTSASAADENEQGPPLPYPNIADTTGASDELVEFMKAFFKAKSNHDVNGTMSFFAPDMVTYIDSTLNWDEASFSILKGVFAQFMPTWPPSGKSYPTRIIGDMQHGAVIAFTDTPELFGGELRILGALNFKHGKIYRWVDYWDFRGFPNSFGIIKSPQLTNYKEAAVGEVASPTMKMVAGALFSALSTGNVNAATSLFTSDAVYEDMTLRAQILGKIDLGRYLARTISKLPLGMGAKQRHTLGWDKGGGVEWNASPSSGVAVGNTALLLDRHGLITRMTSVYDGSLMNPATLQMLVSQSIDP
jgi:hypothetical protein